CGFESAGVVAVLAVLLPLLLPQPEATSPTTNVTAIAMTAASRLSSETCVLAEVRLRRGRSSIWLLQCWDGRRLSTRSARARRVGTRTLVESQDAADASFHSGPDLPDAGYWASMARPPEFGPVLVRVLPVHDHGR